ncbi:MAG: lactoylglutathione lyase [Pseudomonadota bacterium]
MIVNDIKAFVPCKDYQVSISFYKEIGFNAEQASDDLTLLENGDCFLFLQRFYNAELADNFMLQVCVDDINTAHDLCSKSVHKRKISPIKKEPWGEVFYLWGPSGELLHITQLRT